MKRAMIHLQISIHEWEKNELRTVTPANIMEENGLKPLMVVCFDGEDDFLVHKKVREWIEQAGNPRIPPK